MLTEPTIEKLHALLARSPSKRAAPASARSTGACPGCSRSSPSRTRTGRTRACSVGSRRSTCWCSTTGASRRCASRSGATCSRFSTTAMACGRQSSPVSCPSKSGTTYVADPTIADALLDRVVHNAHRIKLKGPSRRKPDGLTAPSNTPTKPRRFAPTGRPRWPIRAITMRRSGRSRWAESAPRTVSGFRDGPGGVPLDLHAALFGHAVAGAQDSNYVVPPGVHLTARPARVDM